MRRRIGLFLLSASLGLVAALPLPGKGAGAQPSVSLILDLDPAAPGIQSTREVAPGASFAVDVIAEGIPDDRPIGTFQFYLIYDDTVILAPEVPDDGTALDDNPDANQEALGPGSDCSSFGAAFPQGDQDPLSGPGHGVAFLACLNWAGPFPATGNVMLATVRFNVVGSSGQQSDLRLDTVAIYDTTAVELASCNPVIYFDAGCQPGEVAIGQAAPSPVEETPTATAATPAVTPAPPSPNGESQRFWPWPGLAWVLVGLAVAAAVAGALFYLRVRAASSR